MFDREAYKKAWAAANRDKMNAASRRYYVAHRKTIQKKNRERMGRFYRENAEQLRPLMRERMRRAYKVDPTIWKMHANLRRARLLKATPSWANLGAVRQMYRNAARLGLTVDHIIPLKGKNVCGLHVENNLQLLPWSENRTKGNSLEHGSNTPLLC